MKKLIVALALGLASITSFAEATFDQVQSLIQQQNYSAAAAGLEGIIQNHPKSAKAFYAMAQAQAGLGNLEKARKALDIATGLNPTLDFAPASSVASLKQAITPQVAKIETIEESHMLRNFALLLLVVAGGYFIYSMYVRKQEEEAADAARRQAEQDRINEIAERINREAAADAARRAATVSTTHSHPDTVSAPVATAKMTKKQLKDEADAIALREAQYRAERAEAKANEAEALARAQASYARSQPSTTVVHQSSSNDMLTGVLIGNMISNSGNHHHDTERTVVRETVREVPAPSRDSSWDDAPAKSSSRSSSWDDDSSSSSSKSSSSWDSSSSSSSSSSWDSGSSSSDSSSSSSSSWD